MRNVLIVVAILAVVLGLTYNSMLKSRANVEQITGDLQAAYQLRWDKINSLVKTVEGAKNFEKSTLVEIIQARESATQIKLTSDDLTPEKMANFEKAQANLSGSLSRLLVKMEAYPDLKSNANFMNLQQEVSETENRILRAREKFNGVVKDYNVSIGTFPKVLFSGLLGFTKKPFFEATKDSQNAPDIQFSK